MSGDRVGGSGINFKRMAWIPSQSGRRTEREEIDSLSLVSKLSFRGCRRYRLWVIVEKLRLQAEQPLAVPFRIYLQTSISRRITLKKLRLCSLNCHMQNMYSFSAYKNRVMLSVNEGVYPRKREINFFFVLWYQRSVSI